MKKLFLLFIISMTGIIQSYEWGQPSRVIKHRLGGMRDPLWDVNVPIVPVHHLFTIFLKSKKGTCGVVKFVPKGDQEVRLLSELAYLRRSGEGLATHGRDLEIFTGKVLSDWVTVPRKGLTVGYDYGPKLGSDLTGSFFLTTVAGVAYRIFCAKKGAYDKWEYEDCSKLIDIKDVKEVSCDQIQPFVSPLNLNYKKELKDKKNIVYNFPNHPPLMSEQEKKKSAELQLADQKAIAERLKNMTPQERQAMLLEQLIALFQEQKALQERTVSIAEKAERQRKLQARVKALGGAAALFGISLKGLGEAGRALSPYYIN